MYTIIVVVVIERTSLGAGSFAVRVRLNAVCGAKNVMRPCR